MTDPIVLVPVLVTGFLIPSIALILHTIHK